MLLAGMIAITVAAWGHSDPKHAGKDLSARLGMTQILSKITGEVAIKKPGYS